MNRFARLLALIILLFLPNSLDAQFGDDNESALLKSIRANNLKEVKRLVETGEPINTDEFMDTEPVDLAVQLGHQEIALYLLDKGAKSRGYFYSAVKQGDLKWIKTLLSYKYYDDEAMIAAVESGNVEIVKYLISLKFPVNFSQKRRTGLFRKHYVTPLEIAYDTKNFPIVLELVKGGANLKDAFHTACFMDYNDLAFQLVDLGKSINDLFLVCAGTNNITVLKYCRQKGADIQAKDENGKNALLLAAENGRRDMFFYCLNDLTLSINSVSATNENALMLVCRYQNIALVSEILALLPNLELKNSMNETVLFYAERGMSPEIFELILSKNPNLNQQNSKGNTALIQAASAGRSANVKRLVELGADIKLKNNEGRNVISGLMNYYSSNQKLVYDLIQQGADANVKSENGSNLAYYAIESGDLNLLNLLKEKGIETDGRSSSGYRPSTKNKDVILFVLENGGDPDAKDTWGTSYLCTALDQNDIELASVLLRYKVNVNAPCSFSETPLMKAIDNGSLLFVQYLVESGADLFAKKSSSKNIMEYAIDKNNKEIIDYLRSKGALTKEELNQREVERAKEMRLLEEYIANKNVGAILTLLNKYPEAILTQKEIQSLGILSAENGNLELLKLFLERFKWDINAPLNFEMKTLLHIAACGNNLQYVTLLVNKGADVKKTDAFDKLAIDYARNKEIKKFLKEKGVK